LQIYIFHRLNYEIAKMKETSQSKIESLEKRIKMLERTIEERDKTHQSIIETYEARIAKFRNDIDHEKNEKLVILKDFNNLKDKYYQETKTSPET